MHGFIKRIKNNKTLMNGTMFSFFSFINRGVSFVLLFILARYILPAEYGRLSLFNTVVQFLGYFIALSCQGFFAISFFQRKGELFRQDCTSILLILTTCTALFCIILIFSQNAIARFTKLPPLFLWFALIISVAQVFFHLLLDYLRVQEKIARYGIASCSFALMNFGLSLFLVINKGLNWEGRVYAHLLCTVIFGAIGIFLLIRKNLFSRNVTWEGTKMILLWGIPLIPHEATSWIKQGCDRFIINDAHTIEDVGIFSFALTLTSIIIMIGTAFNATNSVSIFHILSSDSSRKIKVQQLKNQTRNIGLIYALGYILVLLFGSIVVPIALPKYTASLPFFWITSISGLFNCLYFLYVNYLFYYHKNNSIMVITFLTAVLHLVLSLIFTRYSLYCTSAIYVISQVAVFLLVRHQAMRVLREYLNIDAKDEN